MLKNPKTFGLQKRLCAASGISSCRMSQLFHGKYRPTPRQAAVLEPLLLQEGYSITRWDMLYCPDGTPLLDAARERLEKGARRDQQ